MSQKMTHREDQSEIDFNFVNTIRTHYPAIYKKNTKEYSDRDLTRNSWEGLCQRMGNISVEGAKDWWKRLSSEYKTEKMKRLKEDRSGSAVPVKREHFALYDMFKDMLSTSQASRPSVSNYKSSSSVVANDHIDDHDEEQFHHNHNDRNDRGNDCYNYQSASGRSGKKQQQLHNTLKGIDQAILEVNDALKMKTPSTSYVTERTANRDIGDLIFAEFEQMDRNDAEEKRKLLLEYVANYKTGTDGNHN